MLVVVVAAGSQNTRENLKGAGVDVQEVVLRCFEFFLFQCYSRLRFRFTLYNMGTPASVICSQLLYLSFIPGAAICRIGGSSRVADTHEHVDLRGSIRVPVGVSAQDQDPSGFAFSCFHSRLHAAHLRVGSFSCVELFGFSRWLVKALQWLHRKTRTEVRDRIMEESLSMCLLLRRNLE